MVYTPISNLIEIRSVQTVEERAIYTFWKKKDFNCWWVL